MSPEEWSARVETAAAYRLAAHFGWDDLIFTHISTRIPGHEHHFLLNPLGLMFEEITASNLVKIDVDGNGVDDDRPVIKAGFVIHSAIHMARDDATSIIHLHTPAGQAVSALEGGLLPVTQTAMTLYGRIGYHDYEGIANDVEERQRLVVSLADHPVLILRNHGTLTVGRTMGEAFGRAYFLQRACEAQVLAGQMGRALRLVDHDPAAKTAGQASMMEDSGSAAIGWQTLLRKLDRMGSNYKE